LKEKKSISFQFVSFIGKLFNLVVNLGVSEAPSPLKKRRIRNINFMSLAWIPILLASALFCITTDFWHFGLLMFMTISMLFLVPIFNSFSYYNMGFLIFIVVINGNLILLNVLFSFGFATYTFLFPLFIGLSFLLPLPKYKKELSFLFTSLIFMHALSFLLVQNFPKEQIVSKENSVYVFLNYLFSFSLSLIFVIKYNILQSNQQKDLDEKINLNQQQNELLEKTLKERNLLLMDIHHRTKNNLAIVSSILNLQRHQIEDEKLSSILLNCSNRIIVMSKAHQSLYEKGNFIQIDLKDFVSELTQNLTSTIFQQDNSIKLNIDVDSININADKAIPVALIINELITNSVKYAFDNTEGTIDLKIKKIGNQIIMMVQDNGRGFTYNSDENYTSLGMTLIETLSEQLAGKFEFVNNSGTIFTLHFPCD
jgi:two-component sensor histidine kinase